MLSNEQILTYTVGNTSRLFQHATTDASSSRDVILILAEPLHVARLG